MVVDFTDSGDGTLAAIPELVFAARATSSFPGAFPPFTVGELDRVLEARGQGWPERDDFLRRVLPRHHAAGAADKAVLIDGSVLVNAPFRPRSTRWAVARRGARSTGASSISIRSGNAFPAARRRRPSRLFQTIVGAISELPRQQPIRDNLEAIAARSGRIDRMQAILAAIREEVEQEIEQLFGGTFFLDRPTAARLASWRVRAQAAAAAKAGFSYAAYGHLKLANVIDGMATILAEAMGDDGQQRRHRLRAMIERTIADRHVGARRSTSPVDPAPAREHSCAPSTWAIASVVCGSSPGGSPNWRRTTAKRNCRPFVMRFMSRSPNSWSGRAAWRWPTGPTTFVRSGTMAAPCWIDWRRGSTLSGSTAKPMHDWLRFSGLPRAARRTLLLTYLGFPYFDVATLPLLQGEGLDEFDPIKVDRISPDDATAIRAGGAEATLKGIQFLTFGAFFSRSYRENDYLWGRLHGAERMIDIAVSTLPSTIRLKPGAVAAFKRRAFLAILDEEEARLTAIAPLIASLRREIG